TYTTTLSAVKAQAVHMKAKQAKTYYDRILAVARKHPKARPYADPTKPKYSSTANSSFQSRKRHFAAEALRIVNLLATAAKEPAVIVPGQKPPGRKKKKRR
ncbi:hypothetical protein LCGC14_1944080, partial [marine sediment metagenome]